MLASLSASSFDSRLKKVFISDWIDFIISFSLSILAFVFDSSASSSFADLWEFAIGVFLIALARFPKRRVDNVSRSLYELRDQVITRQVREFPPIDSCKIWVNLESL